MEEKLDFSKIPFEYPMCLNQQCPKASTCLRQLTAQSIPEDTNYLVIVNPKKLPVQQETCLYYRSNVKIRFAKGFIGILESLPHKQMQVVIARLIKFFDRRTYYRVRKGERLLSPSEQKSILNILRSCGIAQPQDFDAYIEIYDW